MRPHENLSLFPENAGHPDGGSLEYELSARRDGYDLVAGVDEAGRGPLAGPVVAAAVILPDHPKLPGIRDSKKMTPKAREKAFFLIQKEALTTGVGVVSRATIDASNILSASLEAMSRAIGFLDPRPDILLVDGIHPVPLHITQKCLKKGDQVSLSISAASVLAKVYRDRIMRSYHRMYPTYGFERNKGYGTRQHLAALKQHGPCPVHRLTFKRVRRD